MNKISARLLCLMFLCGVGAMEEPTGNPFAYLFGRRESRQQPCDLAEELKAQSDVNNIDEVARKFGKYGAVFCQSDTSNPVKDSLFNKGKCFAKGDKILTPSPAGTTPIVNPYTFRTPDEVQSFVKMLKNGEAKPDAYILLFELSCTTLEEVYDPQKHSVTLLYLSKDDILYAITRDAFITKGTTLYSFWSREPEYYAAVNLLKSVNKQIPSVFPFRSEGILSHLMAQLLKLNALLWYRLSDLPDDVSATTLLLKNEPTLKKPDGTLAKYTSRQEFLEALNYMTKKAIDNRTHLEPFLITVDGKDMWISLLPGLVLNESILYVTATKPKPEPFKWEFISLEKRLDWTSDINRDAIKDNQFAFWCAKAMTDENWKLKSHQIDEFLNFLFSGNKIFVGDITRGFMKGTAFIREHSNGRSPEAMEQFKEYVKEVSRSLAPTQHTVGLTKEAINSWIGIAIKRVSMDIEAEKLLGTAFPMLYLPLTAWNISRFPIDKTIEYYYTVAMMLNELKTGAHGKYTGGYDDFLSATEECVMEVQSWVRSLPSIEGSSPASTPRVLSDGSAEHIRGIEERVENTERMQTGLMQNMQFQNQILMEMLARSHQNSYSSWGSSRTSSFVDVSPRRGRSVRSDTVRPDLKPRMPFSSSGLSGSSQGNRTFRVPPSDFNPPARPSFMGSGPQDSEE